MLEEQLKLEEEMNKIVDTPLPVEEEVVIQEADIVPTKAPI